MGTDSMISTVKKIRVLQINAGSGQFGGVSSFLKNVYTHIDTEIIQFDFLSPNITTYGSVRAEIESKGANIYELHCGEGKLKQLKLIKRLNRFLKSHDYDVIHVNSGSVGFNAIVALTAKHSCCNKVIVHSHNTSSSLSAIRKVYYRLCRRVIRRVADVKFACSREAGMYMFGNNTEFTVINNGIEVNKFCFDKDLRNTVRDELRIFQDELLVGFVGRLTEQKNPLFVIDVYSEMRNITSASRLIIVGDGELKSEVEKKVRQLKLEEHVIFIGESNNVNKYMQGMDLLILPSLYEGFGIVAIEAQTAGLKVFASTQVPEETKISNDIEYISLDRSAEFWANEIINKCQKKRRHSNIDSNYDIKKVVQILTTYYRELVKQL